MASKSKWQQLCNDAWFARKRCDFQTAKILLLSAVEEVKNDPADLVDLCVTLNTLANLYAENGDLPKAVAIARSIVELHRQSTGTERGFLGGHLMFLAMVLMEAGEFEEAVQFAEEGERFYAQVMGETHSETQRMRKVLTDARNQLAGIATTLE